MAAGKKNNIGPWAVRKTKLKKDNRLKKYAQIEKQNAIHKLLLKNKEAGKTGSNLNGWKLDDNDNLMRE